MLVYQRVPSVSTFHARSDRRPEELFTLRYPFFGYPEGLPEAETERNVVPSHGPDPRQTRRKMTYHWYGKPPGSEIVRVQNDPEDNSYYPFLVKQMSQLRFWAGTQLKDGMSWSQNLKIIQS